MTEVEICNAALGAIGAELISNLGESSVEADLCRVWYPLARDAVLEDRLWSFAKLKFAPSRLATAPAFDWTYAYQRPAIVLRIHAVDDGSGAWDVPYEPVGPEIHTDAAQLRVVAIERLTDTSRFSPNFTVALAARLASELAIPLRENRQLQADNWNLYKDKLKEATATDSSQGKTERVRGSRLARYR